MSPEMIGLVPECIQDATRNIYSAVRVVFPSLISNQLEQHFDPIIQSDTGVVLLDWIVDHPGKAIFWGITIGGIFFSLYLCHKAENSNTGRGWNNEEENGGE